MSRERLEGILRQELPYSQMRERGIAEILSEYDRLTAENKRLIALLDVLTDGMVKVIDKAIESQDVWNETQKNIAAIRAAEEG